MKRKSSVSSMFKCGICAHRKPFSNAFAIKGCNHWYCSDCIRQYVTLKIQDNIPRIYCPVSDCGGRLEPEHCRSILPSKMFGRWGDALLEAVIPDCDKFYCPSKNCSALLVKGHDFKDIVKSECPVCHKLFCAKCKVPWHSRIKCGEFQNLYKDEREREDIMFMQLAKEEGWIPCSKCKFYVERIDGCSSMICRCGYGFCYDCGAHRIPGNSCDNCDEMNYDIECAVSDNSYFELPDDAVKTRNCKH
ncbi:Atp-dependent rna helicase deah12, chloroplastic [Heracleum sosnowskyi]|uniref:RBR-type E3 ubiquitin transferase n=1 Tax=Heracleum sosnowskyi TaxID=360622 RepID=A0AAD8M0G2_9APIA|nr:Atp-dependent rna helicase deah12, chloroplastic [Heracleum sosnowskyi]